jgi:hypothetical protein
MRSGESSQMQLCWEWKDRTSNGDVDGKADTGNIPATNVAQRDGHGTIEATDAWEDERREQLEPLVDYFGGCRYREPSILPSIDKRLVKK